MNTIRSFKSAHANYTEKLCTLTTWRTGKHGDCAMLNTRDIEVFDIHCHAYFPDAEKQIRFTVVLDPTLPKDKQQTEVYGFTLQQVVDNLVKFKPQNDKEDESTYRIYESSYIVDVWKELNPVVVVTSTKIEIPIKKKGSRTKPKLVKSSMRKMRKPKTGTTLSMRKDSSTQELDSATFNPPFYSDNNPYNLFPEKLMPEQGGFGFCSALWDPQDHSFAFYPSNNPEDVRVRIDEHVINNGRGYLSLVFGKAQSADFQFFTEQKQRIKTELIMHPDHFVIRIPKDLATYKP